MTTTGAHRSWAVGRPWRVAHVGTPEGLISSPRGRDWTAPPRSAYVELYVTVWLEVRWQLTRTSATRNVDRFPQGSVGLTAFRVSGPTSTGPLPNCPQCRPSRSPAPCSVR